MQELTTQLLPKQELNTQLLSTRSANKTCDNDICRETWAPFFVITLCSLVVGIICVSLFHQNLSIVIDVILMIWASLLLLLNIVEGCVVKLTKYYGNAITRKSYIITSAVLVWFVAVILIAVLSGSFTTSADILASMIPFIFLYEF